MRVFWKDLTLKMLIFIPKTNKKVYFLAKNIKKRCILKIYMTKNQTKAQKKSPFWQIMLIFVNKSAIITTKFCAKSEAYLANFLSQKKRF